MKNTNQHKCATKRKVISSPSPRKPKAARTKEPLLIRLPEINLAKEQLDALLKLSKLKQMRAKHKTAWHQITSLLCFSGFGTIDILQKNKSTYSTLLRHPLFINELLLAWSVDLRRKNKTPDNTELHLDRLITLLEPNPNYYSAFIQTLKKFLNDHPQLETGYETDINSQLENLRCMTSSVFQVDINALESTTSRHKRSPSPSPTSITNSTLFSATPKLTASRQQTSGLHL